MAYRNVAHRVWSVARLRWVPALASRGTSPAFCHSGAPLPFLFSPRALPRCPPHVQYRRLSFNVQDGEDFTERVIKSSVPVLIDFHAQWCGPCKILGPRLEKAVAKQQGRVAMAKVDIDEHTDLAIEYGVSAVPTVVAMRDGKVLDQFVGIKDEDQLDSFVGKLVGP